MLYTEDKPYNKRDHRHCSEKDSPCGIQGSHRCCLCEEPFDAMGFSVITDPSMKPGEWRVEKGQIYSNPPSQEEEWKIELGKLLDELNIPVQKAVPLLTFFEKVLADKAKVLREEIEGMKKFYEDEETVRRKWHEQTGHFLPPNEAREFAWTNTGFNQALSDVLETITRIMK